MIQDSAPGVRAASPSGAYAVLRFGDEWRLLYGPVTIGQFRSREAAETVAGHLCRAVANVGFDVDLTVQDHAGELRGQRIPSRLARSGTAR